MKKCTQQASATEIAAVPQTQLAADLILIDKYLSDRNIMASKDGALRYVVSTLGTGNAPCLESTISVTYTGKLMTNGNVFDSSNTAISFALNSLILGWKVGLLNVNRGAVVTLYVPSGYAYGPTARTGIPANSNLIFDITLVDYTN